MRKYLILLGVLLLLTVLYEGFGFWLYKSHVIARLLAYGHIGNIIGPLLFLIFHVCALLIGPSLVACTLLAIGWEWFKQRSSRQS